MGMFIILLLFPYSNHVQAASSIFLSEGTYIVGKEIPVGLNKFSITEGTAEIYIEQNKGSYNVAELDSTKKHKNNHFTASLKKGQEVEIFISSIDSSVKVEKISKVDMNHVTDGYYTIGTDIPVGKYVGKLNKIESNFRHAEIGKSEKNSSMISGTYLYSSKDSYVETFAAGDQLHITALGATIKLTEHIVVPNSITLSKSSLNLLKNQTVKVKATIAPSNAKVKDVVWKSSNTKVAKVDSKGNIKGISYGTATITATAKGNTKVKKTIKVKVAPPVHAKSVKLNKTSSSVIKGNTLTLTATVSPSNTTNKTVKWKSSNKKVATVSSQGKITAVGVGTATITATTSNGKATKATIKVKPKPYTKSLSAGTWKAGTHIKPGRYKITTKSDRGNLVIGMGTNRFVNEILSSKNDGFGVTVVTTDIKSGDKIKISGLNRVQFTQVSHVKANTLHSGYWTVGKDISPGRYKITTSSSSGNLVIHRGRYLLVNEILSNKPSKYYVTSVTKTLKSGDLIHISGLNQVKFTKK